MAKEITVTVKWQNITQAEIAKTMWYKCKTQEDIQALKAAFGFDAEFVHQMLAAEILDTHMETNVAEQLLQRISDQSKWSPPPGKE